MASSARPPKPIEKNLTVAERKMGYLVVSPRRGQFFPAEGVPFRVRIDNKSFETTVEVIRSLDDGPRDQHEHYLIGLPPIMEMPKGAIASSPNRASVNEYELTMISRQGR
jgi:hypothetical protein